MSGVLLHFTYGWSGGNRAVAAVTPANESVWEHLKLVVIPVTVLGLVDMKWLVDWRRLWWAKVVEMAVACGFIVGCFYAYTELSALAASPQLTSHRSSSPSWSASGRVAG